MNRRYQSWHQLRHPQQVLSETKRKRRLQLPRETPSLIQLENSEKLQERFVNPRTARKRKHETIESCSEIHGATESEKRPCLDSMWVTLVNTASSKQLKNYFVSSKKAKKIIPSLMNIAVTDFEESSDNSIQSVKVLYCKGLLSKEKYKSVRQTLCMKSNENTARRCSIKFSGVRVPKILTYEKVISFLKSVDVGTVKDVKSELCLNLEEDDQVEGAYRELEEFLLELADLYIHVDRTLGKEESFLLHFNVAPYKFK